MYTTDLLSMDLCSTPRTERHPLLSLVHSPLDPAAWASALRDHPDRAFVRYLLRGMSEGFRIGFHRTGPLRSAPWNMLSAPRHCAVLPRQRMLPRTHARPLHGRSATPVTCQPVWGNTEGPQHREMEVDNGSLIPPGYSVNDGIDPDLCSLSYCTVDHVAAVAATYSRGALLAKIDIESAYRLIPVHPLDRPLQAVEWDGMLYVDPMLPFGLRSAPKIFNAVADVLEWCIRRRGVQHIFHYLDDFMSLAHPTLLCAQRPWPSWITLAPS